MITARKGTEEGGFQHITYLEVNKDQLWDDTLMMSGTSANGGAEKWVPTKETDGTAIILVQSFLLQRLGSCSTDRNILKKVSPKTINSRSQARIDRRYPSAYTL